jgi:oligopeptide/dipeptide ABC transporter ATP-binding protein
MYLGQIIEVAAREEFFAAPAHPYGEALLSSVPTLHRTRERIVLTGELPDPANPPSGCYFHPRCRYAIDRCKQETPLFRELKPDHFVACHRAEELNLEGI